jgi:hypothetical protein
VINILRTHFVDLTDLKGSDDVYIFVIKPKNPYLFKESTVLTFEYRSL